MTKQAFLDAYRAQLLVFYTWAHDADKLARYMTSVRETLDGGNSWHCDVKTPSVKLAWKAIGGTGKLTLKALRGLA